MSLNTDSINTEVFRHFPVLHTPRLLLREVMPEDAEEIFRMRSNPNVNRFIAREEMQDVDDAQKLVEKVRGNYAAQNGIAWAAQLRGSGNIIGTCGFNRIEHANLRAE